MSKEKRHVLLVDDDKQIVELLEMYLAKRDYKVTSLTDASRTVPVVLEEKPDIVFLDFRMAHSGREVLHAFKKSRIEVPVIVMSAYKTKGDTFELKRLGAKGLIVKPFEFDEIDAVLKKFLPPA